MSPFCIPGNVGNILSYAGQAAGTLAADIAELITQLSQFAEGEGGIVMGIRASPAAGHAFVSEIFQGILTFTCPVMGVIYDIEAYANAGQFIRGFYWVKT